MSVELSMDKTQPHPLFKLAIELGPLVVFFIVNAQIQPVRGDRRVHGGDRGGDDRVLRADAAHSDHGAGHRRDRAGVRHADLVLHDETFIKMKPTIVYLLFAAVLRGGLLFGRCFIAIVFDQMFDLTADGWRKLTMRWALFFLAMAVLNEIIWRTQTTDFWVAFKVFGVIPLTMVFAISQMPLVKRYHLEPASLEASEAEAGDISKG